MGQKTKEQSVIKIIINLGQGVLLLVWGAWYNGVPIHNPFSLSWVKAALFARVPVWVALIFAAAAAILAGLNIRQRERFDVFADFSIDMNPAGPWLYGSSLALDGPIALHTTKQIGILQGRADRWCSPKLEPHIGVVRNKTGSTFTGEEGTFVVPRDALHMHPGEGGIFDVVRWTCPQHGQYSIVGDFSGLDDGDAAEVDVHVRKNSKDELVTAVLRGAPTQKPFDLNQALRKGDTLDFIVGVGPSRSHCNDSTSLRVKMQRIGR
jgi:hypothetical protein